MFQQELKFWEQINTILIEMYQENNEILTARQVSDQLANQEQMAKISILCHVKYLNKGSLQDIL